MPTSRESGASAGRWLPALIGWAIGGALVGFGILTGLGSGFVALAMGIPVLLWVAVRAPQLRIPGGLAAVAGAGIAVAATGAFLVRGEGLVTPQSLVVAGMLPTLLALGALTLWFKVNPPGAIEARRLGPVWIAVLIAGLVLAVVAVVSLLAPPRTAETVRVEALASFARLEHVGMDDREAATPPLRLRRHEPSSAASMRACEIGQGVWDRC